MAKITFSSKCALAVFASVEHQWLQLPLPLRQLPPHRPRLLPLQLPHTRPRPPRRLWRQLPALAQHANVNGDDEVADVDDEVDDDDDGATPPRTLGLREGARDAPPGELPPPDPASTL